MQKITIQLPDRLVERLKKIADDLDTDVSLTASHILTRTLQQHNTRSAIMTDRGQRPDARTDPRLDWWREVKFGMFIHWGLYAIPAGQWEGDTIPGIGEWIMKRAEIPAAEYEKLADEFNPVQFDAKEWVSLAKRAGQKYLVITSKHHDGFCLFQSNATSYNIVDGTPYGRDPLKELAEECRKQDIKLGFYYSQTQDWHHPNGYGNDWDFDEEAKDFDGYVRGFVKDQLTELLTNYGPIGLIWFDTPMIIETDQSQELLDHCNALQPDCLVCGRLGNQLGDYASAGDNMIPQELVDLDWETPATLNDTWGYRTDDHHWKSDEDLIRKLIDIVSKGGNYLLNVGPTAEGNIPQPSVERLEAMGAWLDTNGEAIYGTTPGPIQGVEGCRSTAKPGKVYLHVFDWPEGGKIVLPGLQANGASLLDGGASLAVVQEGDDLVISGPADAPDAIATVVALDV